MEEEKGFPLHFPRHCSSPPATENKEKCWGGRLRPRPWPRKRLEVGGGGGGREEKTFFFQALIPPKGGSRAEEGTILFSHG